MLKLWGRLCLFLVLATSSVSRGENQTAVPPQLQDLDVKTDSPDPSALTPPPQSAEETPNGAVHGSPSTWSPQTVNATDLPSTAVTTQANLTEYEDHTDSNTSDEDNATVGVPHSGTQGDNTDVRTIVSTATASTSPAPVLIEDEDKGSSSWGYVFLVLIILVIIALCVILYILRRVSRTYSFDLQRPVPVSHLNEPIGTFEPVYLDDLDRPAPKDQVTTDDLSPPPVANGTTLQSEEKSSNGESAPQEQPDSNGVEKSATGDSSPSLGDGPADKSSSPLSSTNLLFDPVGEDQQNENNNNPSVSSNDPFVEINLDDPGWCDQFLSSPETPSSVLPLTPFSFSSSSS